MPVLQSRAPSASRYATRRTNGLAKIVHPSWWVSLFLASLLPRPERLTEEDVRLACCFVNRQPIYRPHRESMLFRLSEKDRATFLRLEEAAEFEPNARPQDEGYVIFSNPWSETRQKAAKWIARSPRVRDAAAGEGEEEVAVPALFAANASRTFPAYHRARHSLS